jgi:hypothetical protein
MVGGHTHVRVTRMRAAHMRIPAAGLSAYVSFRFTENAGTAAVEEDQGPL